VPGISGDHAFALGLSVLVKHLAQRDIVQ